MCFLTVFDLCIYNFFPTNEILKHLGDLNMYLQQLYTLNQRTVLFYMDIILPEAVNTNETAGEERAFTQQVRSITKVLINKSTGSSQERRKRKLES